MGPTRGRTDDSPGSPESPAATPTPCLRLAPARGGEGPEGRGEGPHLSQF